MTSRPGCVAGPGGWRCGGVPGPTSGRGLAACLGPRGLGPRGRGLRCLGLGCLVPGQARRCFLWGGLVCAMADAGHHGECQHDQADMPVPAVPGAGFVVVQAKLGLGGLEAVLDGPAAALDLDQLGRGCARGAPGGEERKLAVGQAAPDQQAAGAQPVAAGPRRPAPGRSARPCRTPTAWRSRSGRDASH